MISPYGYEVDTPNYEEFCKENLMFQNSFCVAPTCSPGRTGMLTGLHCTYREFPRVIDEDIHVDFCQPPAWIVNNGISREDYARYKTSVRIADDSIGRVIGKLKERNLYDDTIIILTTDHGITYPFGKFSHRCVSDLMRPV
ncbi:sulfatase-like hydrolase/transferase [Lachnospiraceae bacterium 54-53]